MENINEQTIKLLKHPIAKYIYALIAVCIIGMISFGNVKISDALKVFDNSLVKIIIIALLVFVAITKGLALTIILTIILAIIYTFVNTFHKEGMASIDYDPSSGIPAYAYDRAGGDSIKEGDVAVKGEHGEIVTNDGPISGVSDAEVESLCMHLTAPTEDSGMAPADHSDDSEKYMIPQKEIKSDYAGDYNKKLPDEMVRGRREEM